jgi:hypothetical protein
VLIQAAEGVQDLLSWPWPSPGFVLQHNTDLATTELADDREGSAADELAVPGDGPALQRTEFLPTEAVSMKLNR